MTEKLFQYIWQFQYFNQSSLQTVEGESLQIISPGKLNRDQGPDFSGAQVRINGTLLAGSVELHLKTSQWKEHGHDLDGNYRNVVLHVVFENDLTGFHIPVLELQPRISHLLVDRYASLMLGSSFIACEKSIMSLKEITWRSWKERLLAERLTRKSESIFQFLDQNNSHWEEVFWWMLARSFGAKVNGEAFEQVARSIPVNLLAKHKNQVLHVEALLFGQAGLLSNQFKEDYPKLLQREFQFLRKKYGLQPSHAPIHFLRMRPGNFPTIRMAQLAALVCASSHLLSKSLEVERVSEIREFFDVTANDYWHYHYLFDEVSEFRKKHIGSDMADSIIINTIVPVLFAFGLHHHDEKYQSRAIQWLEDVGAESNSVTRGFMKLNILCENAFDSQALLELKAQYCDNRQCLRCSVGNSILKTT